MDINIPGNTPSLGSRRDEDIALDLMKFIAGISGAGKSNPTTGFTGVADKKPEDIANSLLELYSRCLDTVRNKK